MPHGEPRRAALAVHRRHMYREEMQGRPWCEWEHCSRPAMECVALCLASDGTRLLRPFYLCSQHAEALPLPLFSRTPDPG